jgi:hypothetical protein
MEYFIWSGYFPGSGHAFAVSQEGMTAGQTLHVLMGMKLSDPPRRVRITELSCGELPDLIESAWSSRIISAKLKQILDEMYPDCAQYIPVTVARHPRKKYWVLNPLTSLSCLDKDHSVFATFPRPPHTIRKVRKLVLKPIPDDVPALIHMAELSVLLVRDDLRRAFEAASPSSGKFTRARDYRHPGRY